jgi:ribosomal protein L40E
VALERELLDGERRLQRRLGTPWIDVTAETLSVRLAAGERLIDFDWIGLDWPELRLRVRQVIDVLRRHDIVGAVDADRLHAAGRAADFPDAVRAWFDAVGPHAHQPLDDVIGLAVRPFLGRAADVLQQRVSLDTWRRGSCPMCGAVASFAVLVSSDTRQLVCARCACRWPFERRRCHHCLTLDQLRVFAAHDGVYQITACVSCRHYLKALDPARAGRRYMASVDTVATLTLDQAVAEQGFIAADTPA